MSPLELSPNNGFARGKRNHNWWGFRLNFFLSHSQFVEDPVSAQGSFTSPQQRTGFSQLLPMEVGVECTAYSISTLLNPNGSRSVTLYFLEKVKADVLSRLTNNFVSPHHSFILSFKTLRNLPLTMMTTLS